MEYTEQTSDEFELLRLAGLELDHIKKVGHQVEVAKLSEETLYSELLECLLVSENSIVVGILLRNCKGRGGERSDECASRLRILHSGSSAPECLARWRIVYPLRYMDLGISISPYSD